MMVQISQHTHQMIWDLIDKLEKNNIEIIAQPLRKKFTRIARCFNFLVSNASIDWCLDFFYETNAVWNWKSYGFWKIKS